MAKQLMEEKERQHYNLAYTHSQKLSLANRVRLCIIILEPDNTNTRGKLFEALELLKALVGY